MAFRCSRHHPSSFDFFNQTVIDLPLVFSQPSLISYIFLIWFQLIESNYHLIPLARVVFQKWFLSVFSNNRLKKKKNFRCSKALFAFALFLLFHIFFATNLAAMLPGCNSHASVMSFPLTRFLFELITAPSSLPLYDLHVFSLIFFSIIHSNVSPRW